MKKKAIYIIKKILKLFLIIFIAIFIYQFYISIKTPITEADITTDKKNDINNNSITDILETGFKSVIGVSKLKNTGSSIFLMNASEELGLGTGIIVSKKGYILTNEHVSGNKTCYITLQSGEVVKSKVIWTNREYDLSIIKAEKTFDKCAELGNSSEIKIGENVYAIGNPIGYEFQRTVTSGIISALNRTVKFQEKNEYVYMSNLIQTDATINPGNSGGPLINENGKVIGINSIKITSADSMGFAIPINIVKPIIEKLETTGNFEEAYLGVVAYDNLNSPYAENTNNKNGICIEKIYGDSPAYESNLQQGDIIKKIDNIEINKMIDLQEYIYYKKPKDKVSLTIERNGKEIEVNVELTEKNNG